MQRRMTLFSIAVMTLLVAYATPAAAGHGDGRVAFDELEASVTDSDQLRIVYEVDSGDWQRLEHEGVHPEFNVYIQEEGEDALKYAYNFDLSSRSGSFTLPAEIDGFELEQFQIEVLGFAESWRVRSLAAHGVSGARLAFSRSGDDFAVGAVGRPRCRPADGGSFTDISDSGGDESDPDDGGDSSSDSDTATADTEWKAKTISACKEATTYDSDMKVCTNYALEVDSRWARDTVEACDEAFTYQDDFQKCLGLAREYDSNDPSEVVEACDEVSTYTSSSRKCIRAGASYSNDPVSVIEACDATTTYQDDRETCIELGDRLGSGGAEIIRACSGDSIKSCIESAAR